MNELFQELQQQQTQQQVSNPQRELIQAFKNSSNPSDFIQNLIMQNPQMRSVFEMFQKSGMTPKQFFYQYAQQNGLDPNLALNSLR